MTDFEKNLKEEAEKAYEAIRDNRNESIAIQLFKAGARFGYQQGIEDSLNEIASLHSHILATDQMEEKVLVQARKQIRSLLPSNPPEDQL